MVNWITAASKIPNEEIVVTNQVAMTITQTRSVTHNFIIIMLSDQTKFRRTLDYISYSKILVRSSLYFSLTVVSMLM